MKQTMSKKKKTFNPKVEMEKLIEKEDLIRKEKEKMIVAEYEAQLDDMKQKTQKEPKPVKGVPLRNVRVAKIKVESISIFLFAKLEFCLRRC